MKEALLYQVWKGGLITPLKTTRQESLEVYDPGKLNYHSGPDFTQSRIHFDGKTWVGQVEVHVKSSDWNRHGHQHDAAYENIILHVVYEHDTEIPELEENCIPTLELKDYLSRDALQRFEKLMNQEGCIPCADYLNSVPAELWAEWKRRLLYQRLDQRAVQFRRWFRECQYDWKEVLHMALARAMGFGVNGQPFEQLARMIPLKRILRYCPDQNAAESLLLGAAGLLPESAGDDYTLKLKEQFAHYQNQFDIVPLERKIWKTGRVRPSNRPVNRIVEWVSLTWNYKEQTSVMISSRTSIELVKSLFKGEYTSYWSSRLNFGPSSKVKRNQLSERIIQHLLVNSWLPFQYAYHKHQLGYLDLKVIENSFNELNPEDNQTIRMWQKLGLEVVNSADSQALLELHGSYCSQKKCLFCSSGKYLLYR